jgi:glycyl-tRNA synthetase
MLKKDFVCTYDETGAIGRRYLRAAEAGTAFCITIDFETLEKEEPDVTIRDRDSEKQVRIKIKKLKEALRALIAKEIKFEDLK